MAQPRFTFLKWGSISFKLLSAIVVVTVYKYCSRNNFRNGISILYLEQNYIWYASDDRYKFNMTEYLMTMIICMDNRTQYSMPGLHSKIRKWLKRIPAQFWNSFCIFFQFTFCMTNYNNIEPLQLWMLDALPRFQVAQVEYFQNMWYITHYHAHSIDSFTLALIEVYAIWHFVICFLSENRSVFCP